MICHHVRLHPGRWVWTRSAVLDRDGWRCRLMVTEADLTTMMFSYAVHTLSA